MENEKLVLSNLGHTWVLDLDGTLVKHNGYLIDGKDTFLKNAEKFLCSIPKNDFIILLTSRKIKYKKMTEQFLRENNIRYDYIIYDIPYGERILINDKKESGLLTAIAKNLKRNSGIPFKININEEL